jgi:hypothetical protein
LSRWETTQIDLLELYINRLDVSDVGFFGNTGESASIFNFGLTNVEIHSNYHYSGSLVAVNRGVITNCYATGTVGGYSEVGGLVGNNLRGTISNSYFIGTVDGHVNVGGLVGQADGSVGGIFNSYFGGGTVNGRFYIGGLVGYMGGGLLRANFWDTETSGQVNGLGNLSGPRPGQVEGKTTAEMKMRSTFESAGWDFTNIWTIREGVTYPYLRWQIPSVVPPPVVVDGIQNLVIPTAATGASLSTDLKKKNLSL